MAMQTQEKEHKRVKLLRIEGTKKIRPPREDERHHRIQNIEERDRNRQQDQHKHRARMRGAHRLEQSIKGERSEDDHGRVD